MLINEIVIKELNLQKDVDWSKVKNVKYNGVSYSWNPGLQTFTHPDGTTITPTNSLFLSLIKAQPAATNKDARPFTKRVKSKVASKIGATGLGQRARFNPKAGVGQKIGGVIGGGIGRAIDKLTGKFSKDPNVVNVTGLPQKGDIRTLVDKRGKPIDFPRNDGTKFNHAFEYKGQQWISSETGKYATKDEAKNLNGQYIKKGMKNDPSDDFQNLERQIKAGNISPEDGQKIKAIFKRGEAKTLNDAYQIFQKMQRNATGPRPDSKQTPSTPKTNNPTDPNSPNFGNV